MQSLTLTERKTNLEAVNSEINQLSRLALRFKKRIEGLQFLVPVVK